MLLQVGLLSEMSPEGKVGVSAVCVLGYNVNKGQEISLRLRTDDYKGFRKYLRIRETLVHELAHMVSWQSQHQMSGFVAAHAASISVMRMLFTVHQWGPLLVGSRWADGVWLHPHTFWLKLIQLLTAL